MASKGQKRIISTSSTPSPHARFRTKKCLKLDSVDSDSEFDSVDTTMDDIKDAVEKALQGSVESTLAFPDVACPPGGKKNKNGKSKGQSVADSPSPSTQTIDGASAANLVHQIVQGLTPVLTTAIATAINAATQAMVKAVVKQTADKVQEQLGEKLQQQSLLFKYEVDRLEQYSRRDSLRISGLDEPENEAEADLQQKIVQLGEDMGVELRGENISVCHRLGRKSRESHRSRPVICKFVARSTKMNMLQNKRNLKGKDGYKKVYINEDLTVLRSKLFAEVRKNDKVKSATTREGKVICYLKDPRQPGPVVLETPDDLFKLGYDDIDYKTFGLQEHTVTYMMD